MCAPQPELTVYLDTTKLTVGQLCDDLLKKELNVIAPDVETDAGWYRTGWDGGGVCVCVKVIAQADRLCSATAGTILISSDEDDEEVQRTTVFLKTLADMGVSDYTKFAWTSQLHLRLEPQSTLFPSPVCRLKCEDFLQKYNFNLIIRQRLGGNIALHHLPVC